MECTDYENFVNKVQKFYNEEKAFIESKNSVQHFIGKNDPKRIERVKKALNKKKSFHQKMSNFI